MRLKLYTSLVPALCVAGICLVSANVWADGDPAELAGTEATGSLLPDEQGVLSEEAVATVTADGDFLLPTYLLPGETAEVERTTTIETVNTPQPADPIVIKAEAGAPQETVIRTRTTTVTNVVPAPVPPITVTTQVVTPSDEPKPLPVSQPMPTPVPKPVAVQPPAPSPEPNTFDAVVAQTKPAARPAPAAEAKPTRAHSAGGRLLIPLADVPTTDAGEPPVPTKDRVIIPSEYADRITAKLQNREPLTFAMPHEIRITFYPRASAFSGQTLKWVRAFAWAALRDPRLVVEIRASCAEADLQDKRLALVKGVLQGVGLSTHQIVVHYTDRPVDTMLLRAVPRTEKTEIVSLSKSEKAAKNAASVKKW